MMNNIPLFVVKILIQLLYSIDKKPIMSKQEVVMQVRSSFRFSRSTSRMQVTSLQFSNSKSIIHLKFPGTLYPFVQTICTEKEDVFRQLCFLIMSHMYVSFALPLYLRSLRSLPEFLIQSSIKLLTFKFSLLKKWFRHLRQCSFAFLSLEV